MSRNKRSQETLASLLRLSSPKCDAEALAADFIVRYGSLAPVLESHTDDLATISGMTRNAAQLLSLIPELSRYLAAESYGSRPLLSTFSAASEYLRTQFIGRHYEHCYELCLDKEGALIECTLVQQGTVDETPFYTRLLLESAIRSGAHAVVLSHNHPNGTKAVTLGDSRSTITALHAFRYVGILVLDHIIIADDAAVSLRRQDETVGNLIALQETGTPLLKNWFS